MRTHVCFKCQRRLDASEFYRHPQMGSGHLGKCKKCTRRDVRENTAKNAEYYREYDRERNKTPSRKAMHAAKKRRKRMVMGPSYDRAHNATARAVKNGILSRPSACSRCGGRGHIQAHHDDYSKPLDVMWLCPICHAQRHKELGRLRTVDAPTGTK